MGDRTARHLAVATLLSLALLAGCGGTVSTPASDDASARPTLAALENVSLAPVAETAMPDELPSVTAVASVPPPSGTPGPPPQVEIDYTAGADDLDAFAAAYRAAFSVELRRDEVDAAGGRLCTYLMRHADGAGNVALADALIEADLNEPGYARSDWLAALELANRHYCGEFTVDFAGFGG